MKVQLNTAFGVISSSNIPNQIFNEVINMRTDALDAFAFTYSNMISKEVNYSIANAGPLSVKALLGISDFTQIAGINIFLRQLQEDTTSNTEPLQMNYSITTAGGDVAMGKVSQIQFMGLASSLMTDITISTIPVTVDETTILSIIAFVK